MGSLTVVDWIDAIWYNTASVVGIAPTWILWTAISICMIGGVVSMSRMAAWFNLHTEHTGAAMLARAGRAILHWPVFIGALAGFGLSRSEALIGDAVAIISILWIVRVAIDWTLTAYEMREPAPGRDH